MGSVVVENESKGYTRRMREDGRGGSRVSVVIQQGSLPKGKLISFSVSKYH